jgi:hypothetical protein
MYITWGAKWVWASPIFFQKRMDQAKADKKKKVRQYLRKLLV